MSREDNIYRLLLVEDDRAIAAAIRERAELWNMRVSAVEDFRDVVGAFRRFAPHIVLMDIGLPFYNGYHWCGEIRKLSHVPILFISSAADNLNIVMAMNMGADDFIAKPFDLTVLMAKIQALLRRSYDFAAAVPLLEHRGAVLNTDDTTLSYRGQRLELTKNEYRILLCLLESKGKVVSREKLMEKLWETEQFVDENTLSVNVARLRKKLEGIGLTDFIVTKKGVGYQVR